MGRDDEPEVVRLTVPADPEMVDVVRASVRALCARVGLVDDEVETARNAVGEAFLELADGGGTVEVDVVVGTLALDFELQAPGRIRRVGARRER